MKTVTLDILDDKAINLLKDLETLNVIRVHDIFETEPGTSVNSFVKYKGQMSKQSVEEIDRQLKELRDEWD